MFELRLQRLRASLNADTIKDRQLWLLTFSTVTTVYLVSAHWTLNNTDSVAAAWPAWSLVHQGTLYLEHVRHLDINPWFVRGAHGHLVSSRMPGVVFIGVPMQALFAFSGLRAMAPSVVTAALVTAAAVATMTLLLRRLSNARVALVGGSLVALGTCLWTTAGAELWTHGPDVLWLSLGLLALAKRRHVVAGLLFAPAVLTRPHLVVCIAVVGVVVAWSRRSWRVLPALGAPAGVALAVVIAYNHFLFGTSSVGAGTYSYAANNALGTNGAGILDSIHAWAVAVAGMLFSPMRGLLPYTPAVLLLVFAARPAWRRLPDWGRGAALGGAAYLLAQAHINSDFWGGFGYYGSRLTIEPVFLCAPLLLVAGRELWERGRRPLVFVLCAASVSTELAGAAFGRVMTVPLTADPWRTWLPYEVIRSGGPKAIFVAVLALALAVLVGIRVLSDRGSPRERDEVATAAAGRVADLVAGQL